MTEHGSRVFCGSVFTYYWQASLVKLYCMLGDVIRAERYFRELHEDFVVTVEVAFALVWMIKLYVSLSRPDDVLRVYKLIRRPCHSPFS